MFDISLVIPTYGRYNELHDLLESIATQNYALEKIEVLVIDQNDIINLDPLLKKFSRNLHLIHHKTKIKGIASAKNTGLRIAQGKIITFPDDDCKYYDDTIQCALKFFADNPKADIVYGRVFDRATSSNIMRNWPLENIALNLYNFHLNYSAITCFTKKKHLQFDSDFGAGSLYASGEELDYIITAIEKKSYVVYTSTIDIWHPKLDLSVMPLDKIYGYARGYGATCKKNLSFPILFLFLKSSFYQLLLLIKSIVLFRKKDVANHHNALLGRVRGFLEYRK